MCSWRQSWQVQVQQWLLSIRSFLNAQRHFERKVVCLSYWRQPNIVSLFSMCVQFLSSPWLFLKLRWFFVLSSSTILFNLYQWILSFSIDTFIRIHSSDWIDFYSSFKSQDFGSNSKEWAFTYRWNVLSHCSIGSGSDRLCDANTRE